MLIEKVSELLLQLLSSCLSLLAHHHARWCEDTQTHTVACCAALSPRDWVLRRVAAS
jgi:hypothetical protein